jgi:uncharacterized membrane protein YoaK (UPF0700 family)
MTERRRHGPLPVLLVILTVLTGVIDSVSYLKLGNVFTANMTGNVIFLGFGISGAGEILRSALAISCFAVGAAVGGRLLLRRTPHRGLLLAGATVIQACLVLCAAVILTEETAVRTWTRHLLIGLLALALGCQNAVVRRLDIPDLKTTVITTTMTSLFADISGWRDRRRRMVSIISLLVGAAIGGLLLQTVPVATPLWGAGFTMLICSMASYIAARRPGSDSWR